MTATHLEAYRACLKRTRTSHGEAWTGPDALTLRFRPAGTPPGALVDVTFRISSGQYLGAAPYTGPGGRFWDLVAGSGWVYAHPPVGAP